MSPGHYINLKFDMAFSRQYLNASGRHFIHNNSQYERLAERLAFSTFGNQEVEVCIVQQGSAWPKQGGS